VSFIKERRNATYEADETTKVFYVAVRSGISGLMLRLLCCESDAVKSNRNQLQLTQTFIVQLSGFALFRVHAILASSRSRDEILLKIDHGMKVHRA
jgi:hypothetical protein